MENKIRIDCENLTTDASPSPDSYQETQSSPKEDIKKPHSTADSKPKKSKTKIKKCVPHAVANVYNINNANGIHIGPNIVVNMTKSQKSEESGQEPVKTEAISNIMKSVDIVTHEVLDLVSTHLGKNWRAVMRTLGYSNGQIDQYYEKNFSAGIREVIYQILLDWYQNKYDHATIGILSTILWNAQETELVERLSTLLHNKE